MESAQGFNTVQCFEGKQYIGEYLEYCYTTPWAGKTFSCYYPHSAFFCPTCGEVWGRAIRQYHPGYQPLVHKAWTVYTRPCAKHGDGFFLELFTSDKLSTCTLPLLKREAELLLYHERIKR